jgi:hypothetical protein
MNGRFVGAKDTWGDIQGLARTTLDANKGASVTVLMRKDHTSTSVSTSNRIPYMNGTVVVDLGGNTLTTASTLLECGVNKEAAYETSYTVKNGSILLGAGFLFASESRSSYDKHMTLTLENVSVGIDADSFNAKRTSLFCVYGDQAAHTERSRSI